MASMASRREPTNRAAVGGFARTARGVGRVVAVEGQLVHIRYFRSPGRNPYVDERRDAQEVTATSLAAHSRVYIYDGHRWRIGRVDGQHPQDEDRYLIAFPNSQGEVLHTDSFDVRWDEPITNPFDILEAVGGDSPLVYESRLGLLASWGAQRAVGTGVEGLLLASVELHRHQLRVVRRVAADPIQRYLLADEVGLGKTIEAGALIWQFLRERPNGRVLVIAPEHLREQWAAELLDRFRTGDYADAWLRIRSHEDDASWPEEPAELIVVDEAHHFTRSGRLSDAARVRLTEMAHQADALLLLTATPVRSNEAGFLDLLHLIDPVNYRPDQLDDFVRRVELRDQLALTYQALVPSLDEFDLSLYADELRAQFPNDPALEGLLDAALSAHDTQRPDAIHRLREHLSATYRLHHRLLRTRRTPDIGSSFSVRGRMRAVPFTLEVTDPSDALRRELLDSARSELMVGVEAGTCTTEAAVAMFSALASRASSLSSALMPLHTGTEVDPTSAALRALVDPDVWTTWDALVADIHASHTGVLEELGAVVSGVAVARGLERVVLASGYAETAAAVADEMTRRWGSDRVARHMSSRDDATNNQDLGRWREDGPCSLLVCDAGAEEGLNLQEADLLIHIDLPWDCFRIEQRVGRCDRHGRSGSGPIPSAVVVFGDNPYSLGWFEFAADGCGVFEESLSSLQYVLLDTEHEVQLRVLTDGPSALTATIDNQAELLAQERVRIIAHDSLDAIDEESADEVDDVLLDSDRSRLLTNALVMWLEGVGAGMQRRAAGALRIARRPRPQVPFSLELAMAPHFETDFALDRSTAVSRLLPILRAGHPLTDLLAAHLQSTDRGVAFAMFRPAPQQWPPVLVLRTDFRLTLSAGGRLYERATTLGMSDWLGKTTTELAPPSIETVIATPAAVEVTHPSLRAPYDKQRGDQNLSSRPALFEALTDQLDWTSTCATALEQAEAILSNRTEVSERRHAVGAVLARRIRQMADRDSARTRAGLVVDGHPWAELGEIPAEPLAAATEVVGCGAIFVGDPRRLRST